MSLFCRKESGFTLIELMIAIAISSIVIGAAYSVFNNQLRTHSIQQQVVDVQQDLRAGMDFLIREIRLAGYDEAHGLPVGAGFLSASPAQLQFTMSIHNGVDDDADGLTDEWDEAGNVEFDGIDNDGDGVVDGPDEAVAGDIAQPDENVTYGFMAGEDVNGDGIADDGAAAFGRTDGAGQFEILMDNTHSVAFAYAFDDDEDGWIDFDDVNGDGVQGLGENTLWAVDTNGNGLLDTGVSGTVIVTNVQIDRIRAVRLWLLVRTSREDKDYRDTRTYSVGDTDITPNDGFRRRLLTTEVLCKNMG